MNPSSQTSNPSSATAGNFGKVAMHSWKAAASILPTRVSLSAKGYYDGEMGCLLCPHNLENSLHVFVDCSYAKEVWHRANLSLPIGNGVNFIDWFLDVIYQLDKRADG